MDNASRSERTRKLAIEAALAIIAREGVGKLTLDAIARESGISKGGLLHQFRTKEAVLKALLEHQMAYFAEFARQYREAHAEGQASPNLALEIAKSRELLTHPSSVAFAVGLVVAQEPALMAEPRARTAADLERIRAEAADPDLAVLRWAAARGLALSAQLEISPLPQEEMRRLFARLADDSQWTALQRPMEP